MMESLRSIEMLGRKAGKLARYYVRHPAELFSPQKDQICTTNNGIRMYCSFENIIERQIMLHGVFEEDCTRVVKGHLSEGNVVFDIGSNIGYYSLLFSKLVGEKGQVHCFEPTQYAVERFRGNMALNEDLPTQNIILNQVGLAAEPRTGYEAIESRFSEKWLAYWARELIRFTNLDLYAEEKRVTNVHLVKIDVDGYDYQVIQGAKNVLMTYKPLILCEFCDRVLREKSNTLKDYLDAYISLGYDSCVLLDPVEMTGSLRQLAAARALEKYDSSNALLFPCDS